MCGVNGLFAYGAGAAAPERAELMATREHMRARGPDGAGEWWSVDRRVGLAHRRLAIIDLDARAAQPMLSDDGALALTYNGEIYNHQVLRAELEREGARFRTTSDTEVILRLYEREGPAMVSRLRGMFAFGLYDARRGGLLLARDPYGIKPLYYSAADGAVRFASQVKALLAGGRVSREPDPGGVAGFHIFGYVPEPLTAYRAISAVPSGTTLWIDAAGPGAPRPFANIAAALAAGRTAPGGDLGEAVRVATLDSVRRHLVADVEIGAFLSGGVDSGSLIGLMRDAGQARIRTVTLAFDAFEGAPMDESGAAEKTAALYGADHLTRRVAQSEFLVDLPAILEAMDQPTVDGVNTWFVAKAARELGLKVAFSGLGGDELLAGYPSFLDVPRRRRQIAPIANLPGAANLTARMIRLFAPGLARDNPKTLGVVRYGGDWAGGYMLRRAVRLPEELGAVMTAEAAREGLERLQPLQRLRQALTPDPGEDAGRIAALESACYLRNQLLRDADWAGMAHSVEIRTPLVDYALLQALAPFTSRMTAGAGKRVLAMAPSTPLGAEVADRPKLGFAAPINAWTTGEARTPHRLDSRRWAKRVLDNALGIVPDTKPSITVIILAFNEAMHIERCITRLWPIARRIIVVDSLSLDNTVELARRCGAEVFERAWKNHADQFQWALDTVEPTTDWVMRIDADEYLEDGLKSEIAARLDGLPAAVSGIDFKLKVIFRRRSIRWGGYYGAYLTRLWRNGMGRIEQRWMDERIVLSGGETIPFKGGDLVDENLNDIGWWTAKHNGYATLQMIDFINLEYGLSPIDGGINAGVQKQARWRRFLRNRVYAGAPLYLRAVLYFLQRYFLRLGFLDGREGFVWHVLQGFWFFMLMDAKIDEARGYIRDHGVEAFKQRLIDHYQVRI